MPTASRKSVSRPSKITPAMRAALQEFIDIRSDREQDEIQDYFKDKFDVVVSKRCIGRALNSMNITRKVSRRVALQQDPDLRDVRLTLVSTSQKLIQE